MNVSCHFTKLTVNISHQRWVCIKWYINMYFSCTGKSHDILSIWWLITWSYTKMTLNCILIRYNSMLLHVIFISHNASRLPVDEKKRSIIISSQITTIWRFLLCNSACQNIHTENWDKFSNMMWHIWGNLITYLKTSPMWHNSEPKIPASNNA